MSLRYVRECRVSWPYGRCGRCGKVIRINKPLIGSLHFCEPAPEEQDEETPKDSKTIH